MCNSDVRPLTKQKFILHLKGVTDGNLIFLQQFHFIFSFVFQNWSQNISIQLVGSRNTIYRFFYSFFNLVYILINQNFAFEFCIIGI